MFIQYDTYCLAMNRIKAPSCKWLWWWPSPPPLVMVSWQMHWKPSSSTGLHATTLRTYFEECANFELYNFVGVIVVGEPWLRRRLRADQDVHNSDEFCERMGSGVPPPGRDQHAVLDWDPSQRTTAVARQSPLTDGLTPRSYLFRIVVDLCPHIAEVNW